MKNSDPVSHNIHPNPRNNRKWNQQQSPGSDKEHYTPFRPAGGHGPGQVQRTLVDEILYRRDGPSLLRRHKPHGRVQWNAIPPGEYTVAAWHESLGELTEKITLAKNAEGLRDCTFRLPD